MNTIGIFEAKSKLSQICEQVHETHEPVLITKRGVPLVKIEPIASRSQTPSDIWERRNAFLDRYGELPEFELPIRGSDGEYRNPFDE
ncbi:MAG: type II toxin-antitoxin system Phd/YefM family antitoxin [bacterium]|nr:type II toxin-antitoxin system Phd/YefM family antitoxin [bacterium]